MSVILLGGNGYIGSAFGSELLRRGIPFKAVTRAEFNGENPRDLARAIQENRASFLINAAGYTGKPNVDACEDHKAECMFGNAVLPGRVAVACRTAGIPWGHVSSGCIFSGSHPDGSGFTEVDEPNFCFRNGNCSFYSGTKALGEEVLANEKNVYVWRLRIPFDAYDCPRNYLSKLMAYDMLLQATNSISHRADFVSACVESWRREIPCGIYNVTNPGSIATSEIVELLTESDVCRKKFRFFPNERAFMQLAARTPRSNCVMSSQKLASFGIHLRPVREAIRESLAAWTTSDLPV